MLVFVSSRTPINSSKLDSVSTLLISKLPILFSVSSFPYDIAYFVISKSISGFVCIPKIALFYDKHKRKPLALAHGMNFA